MADLTKKQRKEATFVKTQRLFRSYSHFLIVSMDNVTALQLQQLKQAWRSDTEILHGKNTVILKALTALTQDIPELAHVLPLLKQNVAFVFSKRNFKDLKDLMQKNSRDTYASVGQTAQRDIFIRKCVTSMGPEKTKFFQALDIFTKITKGKVEITNDVLVLKQGDRVQPSQANLLALMDIKAFTFFMRVIHACEDGCVYDPWIIDLSFEDVIKGIEGIAQKAAALSLGMGVHTQLSVPFEIRGAYKKCLGLAHAIGIAAS